MMSCCFWNMKIICGCTAFAACLDFAEDDIVSFIFHWALMSSVWRIQELFNPHVFLEFKSFTCNLCENRREVPKFHASWIQLCQAMYEQFLKWYDPGLCFTGLLDQAIWMGHRESDWFQEKDWCIFLEVSLYLVNWSYPMQHHEWMACKMHMPPTVRMRESAFSLQALRALHYKEGSFVRNKLVALGKWVYKHSAIILHLKVHTRRQTLWNTHFTPSPCRNVDFVTHAWSDLHLHMILRVEAATKYSAYTSSFPTPWIASFFHLSIRSAIWSTGCSWKEAHSQ